MGLADMASEREMSDREFALAQHRAAHPLGDSCSHCRECGDPIPKKRRQAVPGVTLCVDCQTVEEKRNGGRPA